MSWDGATNLGLNVRGLGLVKGMTREVIETVEDLDVAGYPSKAYDLHKYTGPDGRVFVEYEQHYEHLCDGDHGHYFLALKDAAGVEVPESLWTPEELERGCFNEKTFAEIQNCRRQYENILQDLGVKIVRM